jgi:serine/threonine-protein kinase
MVIYHGNQSAYHGEINEFISQRYHVIGRISIGGTSEIYKAVDISRKSQVVIKILPPYYSASDEKGGSDSIGKTLDISHRIIEKSAEFLTQEANFLKNCHHTNIIRLRDYNLEVPRPYIVLDYLGDITLEKEIFNSKRRISIKKTLGILTHICAALGYIHRKGFVFCDVKPSNIISRRKKYTLIDFGLVRPVGMPITGGTIGYMAPEVLQHDSNNIEASPTLDIYALGILLYELLTGFHPLANQKIYSAKNSYSFDRQSISDKSTIPSLASDLNPLLPKALDEILFNCIKKNPKERYQNMDALHKDFEKEASKLIQTQP